MKRHICIKIAIVALVLVAIACTACACSLFKHETKYDLWLSFSKNDPVYEKEVPVGNTVSMYMDLTYLDSTGNNLIMEMHYDDYEYVFVENDCEAKVNYGDSYAKITASKKGTAVIKAQYFDGETLLCESNAITIRFVANYISTVEELKAIANSKESFILSQDIDLSEESDWTPIAGYSGVLNGDGHTISGLKLRVRSDDNVGLFGELKGTVTNLKMTEVNITGSGSGNNVGCLAGKNSGTISNCEVSGTINVDYSNCVGGIVGYSNANLSNNVNKVNVGGNEKVGGVAGYVLASADSKLDSSTNEGSVTGAKYVGGIVGSIESSKPTGVMSATMSNLVNKGTITSTGDCAGGIAGQALGRYKESYGDDDYMYLDFSDCENTGLVSGKNYIGGIFGYGGEYVRSVTACTNSVDIVGENYVGGYAGYANNATLSNMNNVNKITGKGYVGGIAGLAGKVQNCKNNGQIVSLGTILESSANMYYVGGIAGSCQGAVKCENSVDITVDLAGSRVGGIAGAIVGSGSIENCVNTGKITAEQCDRVGGIVGYIYLRGNRTIKGNTNEADVSGATCVGGMAGSIESKMAESGYNYTATFSDCTNTGKITASGNYVGGIAGQALGQLKTYYSKDYVLGLEISDCENSGVVVGKDYVGGIYGNGGSYVKSAMACVNKADITGENYVGGYIGYSANTATSNMNNSNKITGKGYVGGIAGYTGKVQNCKNDGQVVSQGVILQDDINKYCLGGVAGFCTGATKCTNSADINVNLSGYYVGGIAGDIRCASTVDDNSNTGKIEATSCDKVGGIAGRIVLVWSRTVSGNTNDGDIVGANYVGGLTGSIECSKPDEGNDYTSTVSNCTNNGSITASGNYAGGITGQASGSRLNDYFYGYSYCYVQISSNNNYGAVTAGGSNRAAIVGKAGDYVNTQNKSLWDSNNDHANVGKLYN